jgi:hypothetical protein
VFTEIFLDSPPKEFNEVQLTMKFGQKDTEMSCRFRNQSHQDHTPHWKVVQRIQESEPCEEQLFQLWHKQL